MVFLMGMMLVLHTLMAVLRVVQLDYLMDWMLEILLVALMDIL